MRVTDYLTPTERAAQRLLVHEKRCELCKHKGELLWRVRGCNHPKGPYIWPRRGVCRHLEVE